MFYLAIACIAVGLFLLCLSIDVKTRDVNFFNLLLGLTLTFVGGPAAFACDKLGYGFSHEILLAALGIVGGVLIVLVMIHVFANSSPFSQDFGQWFAFGWVKWDDFAVILVGGALLLLWGASTLLSQTSRALEYQAANASVKKLEHDKVASTFASAHTIKPPAAKFAHRQSKARSHMTHKAKKQIGATSHIQKPRKHQAVAK